MKKAHKNQLMAKTSRKEQGTKLSEKYSRNKEKKKRRHREGEVRKRKNPVLAFWASRNLSRTPPNPDCPCLQLMLNPNQNNHSMHKFPISQPIHSIHRDLSLHPRSPGNTDY
jgi:hypothetical protein